MPQAIDDAPTRLQGRLQERRSEIEQALLTRVFALSDPTEMPDAEYADGLRAAVSAVLDFGLANVRRGQDSMPPIPAPLLNQARLDARNGIGLDTMLRRYFAGYTLLNDFLLEEAGKEGLVGSAALLRLIRSQVALFDRLLAAVSEEHGRELGARLYSAEQRRVERVERLLDGELLDTTEFAYSFDCSHLAAIGSGSGVAEAIRDLVSHLDCRLMLVQRDEQTAWAWLGSRRGVDAADLERLTISSSWSSECALAIGESADGLAGWRFSHHQARAALVVAMRRPGRVVRYADVALLASMLQDDLFAASLHRLYLAPLERERDGGKQLRETLRAYFAAGRNVSSAAAMLGVSRQAVAKRLVAVEGRLGRSLEICGIELEAALGLEDLNYYLSRGGGKSQPREVLPVKSHRRHLPRS